MVELSGLVGPFQCFFAHVKDTLVLPIAQNACMRLANSEWRNALGTLTTRCEPGNIKEAA
eukprot:3032300-Pyramimonas_sp.AAC.1